MSGWISHQRLAILVPDWWRMTSVLHCDCKWNNSIMHLSNLNFHMIEIIWTKKSAFVSAHPSEKIHRINIFCKYLLIVQPINLFPYKHTSSLFFVSLVNNVVTLIGMYEHQYFVRFLNVQLPVSREHFYEVHILKWVSTSLFQVWKVHKHIQNF